MCSLLHWSHYDLQKTHILTRRALRRRAYKAEEEKACAWGLRLRRGDGVLIWYTEIDSSRHQEAEAKDILTVLTRQIAAFRPQCKYDKNGRSQLDENTQPVVDAAQQIEHEFVDPLPPASGVASGMMCGHRTPSARSSSAPSPTWQSRPCVTARLFAMRL